jgi:predicted O-methyltransferase YrrM
MSRTTHADKEVVVRGAAEKFAIRQLVETGFGEGMMVRDVAKLFDKITSIELDQERYRKGVEEFGHEPSIHLLCGDSAELLPAIVRELEGACLFWLDAHMDDTSPIISELHAVLSRGGAGDGDVVIVDDLRFLGRDGWPSVAEVLKTILTHYPEWTIKMQDDVLTAHR